MDVSTLLNGDKDCCHLSNSTKNDSRTINAFKQEGFSLFELLTTLSIITILSLTIPNVSAALIYSNKIAAAINKVSGDMSYARSEAITRGRNVELCKSENGQTCTNRNQWESGWIIFVDNNKNRRREASEVILRYQPKIKGINITYRGTASSNYIRFRADGATGVNGTFAFCSDTEGLYKKALILFRTGRLRLSETRTQGRAISCENYRL